MLTPGLSTSTVTVCEVAAVLELFAASVATPAATFNVTVPLEVGVIVAVQVVIRVPLHAVPDALAVTSD